MVHFRMMMRTQCHHILRSISSTLRQILDMVNFNIMQASISNYRLLIALAQNTLISVSTSDRLSNLSITHNSTNQLLPSLRVQGILHAQWQISAFPRHLLIPQAQTYGPPAHHQILGIICRHPLKSNSKRILTKRILRL